MKRWTVRLGLSLMIVVGFWANRLPAQEIFVIPTIPYEPAQQPLEGSALSASRLRPAPAQHPFTRALNSHGLSCKDDPYYPTCGSLHYELRFIFGSCRSFFDQPCVPNQPCAERRSQRVFQDFLP